MDTYPDHYNQEARLVILKALAEQNDYRLNDSMLLQVMERYAISRGRSYLRSQLNWLRDSASAVRLTEAGTAVIAEITETGLDHVERRQVIDGIKRPSPMRGA